MRVQLITYKPVLTVQRSRATTDGEIVATGSTVGMGNTEEFNMTFTAPNMSSDLITNNIEAGEYLGIGLDLGKISNKQMEDAKMSLETTKAKLESDDFEGITKDDILGDLLYTTAISYHLELGFIKNLTRISSGVIAITQPSETIFSSEVSVFTLFSSPLSTTHGGFAMDADRLMTLVKALDGSIAKPEQFLLSAGMSSSALEHSVPEQLLSATDNPALGISAIKALQLAGNQGIPIYKINQDNINSILPQLQLDAGTLADIQNAVNAGMVVTAPQSDITFNDWTGSGYIIIDPDSGAGAYMISGGYSGAFIKALFTILGCLLALPISWVTTTEGELTFTYCIREIVESFNVILDFLGEVGIKGWEYWACEADQAAWIGLIDKMLLVMDGLMSLTAFPQIMLLLMSASALSYIILSIIILLTDIIIVLKIGDLLRQQGVCEN